MSNSGVNTFYRAGAEGGLHCGLRSPRLSDMFLIKAEYMKY